MKAQMCETTLWKQHYASGPGQLSAVHAFGEAAKGRGVKGIYLCHMFFIEAERKQSVTKGRLQSVLVVGDKERENSLSDSVLKVLQSYLPATPYSSLFLDPYQLVQIQSSAQCHPSVKSFKKAECSWPVGLNSSLNLPTDGNFPGQGKKPSLPNKHICNLEILLCSTTGTAQGRRLLFASLHFLEMKEELWKKSAQEWFGQCCVKWHHY